jgi:tetratricopeptide (TPR) repeat protein
LGDGTAAAESRKAQEISPGTPIDLFLAGREELRHGDPAEAARDLEGVLRLRPDDFWAQYFLAAACLQSHRPAEARACLTACLARRKNFVWLYVHRGFAHAELGETAAAEQDYQSALDLKPDDLARYAALVSRGAIRARRGRTESACADLCEAVALRPEEPSGHINLARVYQKQGELSRALAQLDRAIRLRPDEPSLYRVRARVHGQQHEDEAALADLAVALRLDAEAAEDEPGHAALADDHLERGRIFFRTGRYPEALTACDTALALRSDLVAARRLRAETLVEMQQFEAALAALDDYLVALARPDATALRTRGIVRSRLGRNAAALEDFGKSLELQPDAATYAARGWAYLGHDAPRLALPDFEEAMRRNPDGADARVGRAMARAKLGHYAPALADADEAVRLGPASARLAYNAARVYALAAESALGDAALGRQKAAETHERCLDAALKLLTQAVEAQPAPRRAAFWSDVVLADAALRPLRRSAGFARLAEFAGAGSRSPPP